MEMSSPLELKSVKYKEKISEMSEFWRGSASPEGELADSADKKQPVDSWKYSRLHPIK
jgi:hypothetical protein